tara:strand:+ start:974 stop:2242 length:1269 start_codon:yes stop_codon:yes gene_type:complete
MADKFPFRKILILTQYFKPEMGAPQIRLSEFCKELVSQGIEVNVITCMPNYPDGKVHKNYKYRIFKSEIIDGVKVRRVIHYPAVGRKPVRRLLSYFSFTIVSIFPLIFSKKMDLIFVEAQPIILAFPALLVKLIRGTPYIYNTPDLQIEYADEKKWVKISLLIKFAKWIEKLLMKNSFSVTTVTHSFIRYFIKYRSISESIMSFLPNGADTKFLKPIESNSQLRNKFNLENKIIFSYVGTHSSYQGLETIIYAAKILMSSDNIAILMIGKGSERGKLKELAKKLKINNVHFFQSPYDEMDKLMSITYASIVTLRDVPSARRMRLSKAIPPISCGVPVLYAGYGETLDILLKYKAGIAVEPENPDDLAKKIIKLAYDKDLRAEMSRNCRTLAKENFDWKTIINNWQNQITNISKNENPKINGL